MELTIRVDGDGLVEAEVKPDNAEPFRCRFKETTTGLKAIEDLVDRFREVNVLLRRPKLNGHPL